MAVVKTAARTMRSNIRRRNVIHRTYMKPVKKRVRHARTALLLFVIVAAISAACGIGYWYFQGAGVVLDRSMSVSMTSTSTAALNVSFDDSSDRLWLNASVDLNGDGVFEDDEWVIQNVP